MDLIERQLRVEQEYTNQGILLALQKWERDQADGRMADTGIGRQLTVRTYQMVVAELEVLAKSGTRGIGGRYRTLLTEVGLQECAVIGLRAALGLVGHSRVKSVVSRSNRERTGEPLAQDFISEVGTNLETEHMLKKLQVAAPGYMFRVVQSLDDARTRSVSHRRRTFMASADNVQVGSENVAWAATEREGVARLLLQAVISAGVLETYSIPKSRGQSWVALRATAEIEEYVHRMGNNLRAFVMYPPMLVPPKEHTTETMFRGASYLSDAMAHLAGTVTMRSRRGDHRNWVQRNMSQAVLDSANKAARQQYVIDAETATLLRDLYSQGIYNGICGIPSKDPITPPEYPLPEGWSRDDETLVEQHDAWKAMARQAYADEIVRKSHVLEFNQTLKYLREYTGDILYFPTYFDWRGRLYFRSRINPQSTDFVKAVLQFANKKKLGTRGLYWLKGHVATCYGFDKKHPDARAVWADDNIDLIRDAVENHVDSDFFRGADSPWCFYVAARELIRAIDSGDPTEWESGIPVAMDATCSGMQHLSAILRDPVGGLFTNLVPNNGEEKEDIYAAVAAVAIASIQHDTDNPVQSRFWLDAGVFRADAKRPVMTYVYGGTLMSCTEYVLLSMQERGLLGTEEFSQFKMAAYLSRHLRKGIETAVPSSAECMRYLRMLASLMPDNEAMRWITPAGFPVLHHYPKEDVVKLNLPALGVQLNMTRFDDSCLNLSKCVNGIAPNFVHSLDSAHLVRVLSAFDGSIVPIHDSFATHAADVDRMHTVLREEFVQMYSEADPLQTLTDVVQAYCCDEILMPSKGNLSISAVRDSVFFMC